MKNLSLAIIASFAFLLRSSAQSNSTLQQGLIRYFPANSDRSPRWVYYPDKANFEKVDEPLVHAQIPSFEFYRANLTLAVGDHTNQITCLILFDSTQSKALIIRPPWWLNGISRTLIRLFIGHKFATKDSLLSFLTQLNELQQIGSGYTFILTSYSDNLITYDLAFPKSHNNAFSREIRIDIKDLTIFRFTAINPLSNGAEVIDAESDADAGDVISMKPPTGAKVR